MTYLLDVNVLLALGDQSHVHYLNCSRWFGVAAAQGWATCPIVENGMVKVFSQPSYASGPRSIRDAAAALSEARSLPGYIFIPDDVSIADEGFVRTDLITKSSQVTDAYLLGLCRKHGLKLATLDKGVFALQAPGEDLVELID